MSRELLEVLIAIVAFFGGCGSALFMIGQSYTNLQRDIAHLKRSTLQHGEALKLLVEDVEKMDDRLRELER